MKFTFVVEIPKGSDRRIHKSIETGKFVDYGPTKEIIPINEGKMPVCYGFLKNTLNKDEGDEIDCLLISNKEYSTGQELEIEIIGMINREDGDHKVIATDNTTSIKTIDEIDSNLWKLIQEYFEYNHKIVSIENKNETLTYLNNTIRNKNIFYNFFQNIISLYRGRNLIWQIVFILLTFILVTTGFDYFYFESTRNATLDYISFGAASLGFFIPVILPVCMYLYAKIKNNQRIKNATYAIIQAGILGLAISTFYKVFTGRVGPMHTVLLNTDITHMFRFGILKGGAFAGWPSSHTSVAFAMSMTLVTLFPQNKVVKYSAIIYAIYIGLGVSTTIHWFSDFAAGVILGTIIGITVGKSFLKNI